MAERIKYVKFKNISNRNHRNCCELQDIISVISLMNLLFLSVRLDFTAINIDSTVQLGNKNRMILSFTLFDSGKELQLKVF